jgi:putative DeoR family transcriptional regulator (stage III sporulation protein D)
VDRVTYDFLQQERIKDRILQEAQWLIDNTYYSIRGLAKEFMISKSQVHRDLHELKHIDDDLYVQVKNILRKHKRR